ncbi:MAG TPA: hypothetical protein VKY37_01750 [Brumimicrobium sp.]|nr:hypothetical protein [Brumimicrobium sp.]
MKKLSIILIFIIVSLSACKEKSTVDFGYDYFPMKEGHFVEYDVLEIFHDVNVNPQHDTVRYRLKTKIGEKLIDNSNRPARKFHQYKYDQETNELLEHRVWTRIVDGGRGEVVEENQRKIRMIFSVKNDIEWDVNAFNPEKKQTVYYSQVNSNKIISSFDFDATATIEYEDFFSLVDHRRMYEVYAKDVGLVKRSFKDLRIQNFDTLDVRKGTELHYQIINFGSE